MSILRVSVAWRVFRRAACLSIAIAPAVSAMQDGKAEGRPRPIQDNSFLIEEAYNQETRVVQHISGMAYQPSTRDWNYSFTQEWPVAGLRHQLSYTVPIARVETAVGARRTAIGDAALNYRYQLVGSGESRLAVAPRVSVVLPTGDTQSGFGRGRGGIQANLPVSAELGRHVVTHVNAGLGITPRVAGSDGAGEATLRDAAVGQSVIWLAHPRLNLMTEALWARTGFVSGGRAVYTESFLLSPGVRGAFNFESGLQVVPGVAMPIEMRGPRTTSVFTYLSLEHPF